MNIGRHTKALKPAIQSFIIEHNESSSFEYKLFDAVGEYGVVNEVCYPGKDFCNNVY